VQRLQFLLGVQRLRPLPLRIPPAWRPIGQQPARAEAPHSAELGGQVVDPGEAELTPDRRRPRPLGNDLALWWRWGDSNYGAPLQRWLVVDTLAV